MFRFNTESLEFRCKKPIIEYIYVMMRNYKDLFYDIGAIELGFNDGDSIEADYPEINKPTIEFEESETCKDEIISIVTSFLEQEGYGAIGHCFIDVGVEENIPNVSNMNFCKMLLFVRFPNYIEKQK